MKIQADQVDGASQDRPRTIADVPLAAMLGFLAMLYAWLTQVLVWLGNHFSDGEWPTPPKCWAVGALVIFSTAYRFIYWPRRSIYSTTMGRTRHTIKQAVVIVCFMMSLAFFVVWLILGPPGPEFRPK